MSWADEARAALDPDALVEGGARSLKWRGRLIWKNPLDLVIYQEIAWQVQPTLVIETGTHEGGSALFWRQVSGARVVTIDVVEPLPFYDQWIVSLVGSSTSEEILRAVRHEVRPDDIVLVNLDSDHNAHHVGNELKAYGPLVSVGSYMIVEDGVDDLRFNREGPRAATVAFLAQHPEFEADLTRERLGLTNCPGGFLRRTV